MRSATPIQDPSKQPLGPGGYLLPAHRCQPPCSHFAKMACFHFDRWLTGKDRQLATQLVPVLI